jgi:hypothetical protein
MRATGMPEMPGLAPASSPTSEAGRRVQETLDKARRLVQALEMANRGI